MRTFVGIELTRPWRDALVAGCDVVRDAAPGWVDQKWVPAENLHITLKFLGDLSADAADTLPDDIAEAIAGLRRFELEPAVLFHPVPNRKRATMLWTTLHDPEGSCSALAERVEDAAARYGVLPDTREFKPHVTLCRTRRPRSFRSAEEAAQATMARLSQLGAEAVMSVPAVTVFKSTLTRQRPHYERIATIALAD